MKRTILAAAFALAGVATAQAETSILLHNAIPTIWAPAIEKLTEAFHAANPDIEVVVDGPAESYEDGVQRLLRENVAGSMPDVAFVGLNLWRVLEARGLAQELEPFMGDKDAFLAEGYGPAARLGQFNDRTFALGASASTLVMYVNVDLVEKAGGSMADFPQDWDGLIALASRINDLGPTTDGIWLQRHDWRFQSLLGSYGGRPLTADESDIAFDDEAGIAAARLFNRFTAEAGMKTYDTNEARQAFPAGALGIMLESSSLLNRFVEGAGDRFEMALLPLPISAPPEDVYFPTGGSGVVMLATDEAKQQASWTFMRFAMGPEGAKIIVENTGFAPTNSVVVDDAAYLADFYAANPLVKPAHEQIARFAGPWYSFPGDQGVAVTDLIAAAMVEISDGQADPEETVRNLAETMRDRLDMN